MTNFVTRFAPSPTGFLHLGHAFAALTAWDAARSVDGLCLLRLEDLDQGRARPEFESAIYEDLAWLGLTWPEPVVRQSEHLGRYETALLGLAADGLVYRCFKTRKDLAHEAANAPHIMPRPMAGEALSPAEEEARLNDGQPFAWRLSMRACAARLGPQWDALRFEADGCDLRAEPALLGDVILGRKEFPASYHLASVLDDAAQGVTHVIRGEDLKQAAHLHVLLQALLGLPTPVYRHHRLILNEQGRRLAKRDAADTLRALRAAGETPEMIRRRLGLPAC
jgi:glutamyl-Q tRNA(Asp) synthetase